MAPNSLAKTSARYARWREGLLAVLKSAHSELLQRNAEERLSSFGRLDYTLASLGLDEAVTISAAIVPPFLLVATASILTLTVPADCA
jgi:hypothetical protein